MRHNKKAFTIIELVIVIAIVAILAAVLIPTFVTLVHKASESNTLKLVRNLNTALKADKPDGVHDNMYDALKAAEKFGYNVDKINASKTDNEILWDSVNGCFVYMDGDVVKYAPELKDRQNVANSQLWRIVTDKTEATSAKLQESKYSAYLACTVTGALETNKGLDVGENTGITEIKYVNTASEQTVAIRTNGGTLTVNAPLDIVHHYGAVDKAVIEKIADASYHENGKVAVSLEVKAGHVVVEPSAVIKEVLVPQNAAATTKVDIKENSTVTTIVVDSTAATVEVKENAKVEQVVAPNESDNITLPSSIASNKVAKTVVTTKDELIAAINNATVKYIELGANIDVVNAITIDRDLTIDGTANKYSITASKEDRTEGRTINIGRADNAAIKVTLKNLKVAGPAVSGNRGLNIWYANVSLDLIDSEVTCAYYAINITSLANKTKLNVFNSKLSGWAALNIWAAYNEINVVNSELIGTNDKSEGGSNDFATICFEADTTDKTADHVFSSTVVIRSSVVKAIETNSNQQCIVSFNYNATQSSVGNKIEFFDCTLEYSNGHDFVFNDAPNQVFVNGEEKVK